MQQAISAPVMGLFAREMMQSPVYILPIGLYARDMMQLPVKTPPVRLSMIHMQQVVNIVPTRLRRLLVRRTYMGW